MIIEKRKNNFEIRKMINYKSYVLKFNHRPSKKEIEKAINELIAKKETETKKENIITLSTAIRKYIDLNTGSLSPTTLRTYTTYLRILSNELLEMKITNIKSEHIQKFINIYALSHSPKTCKDIVSIIQTPIKFFEPDTHFKINTPQKVKQTDITLPTDDDIERLKAYYKGTPYETIFLLSLYGLRQSEIQALTIDDLNIDTGILKINKAKVLNKDNEFVLKTTKTIESNRQIKLNDYLKNLIIKQKYITKKSYSQYEHNHRRTLKKLNIKYFSLHKYRHYFASKLHLMNIPDKYIQALGGWATDNVLKRVYTHTIETETIKINDLINKELF